MTQVSSVLADGSNLIPRKVLFGNPDKMSVSLSHDGKYISYIAPLEGVLNIFVAPVSNPLSAKPISQDKSRGIRSYYWAYDNEHIIFPQDDKGDENYRLYSYNLKTSNTNLLTPQSDVKAAMYGMSYRLPNEILVGLNERDKRYFDVYKIDLQKGSKELVFENNKFTSFAVDNELKIRFGSLTTKEGDEEYYQLNDDKWQLFTKVSIDDSITTGIISFDKTGKILYMLDSRDRNTGALKTLNLENNETKLIAEDSRADIRAITSHPTEDNIQAVEVNYDKLEIKVLDNSIKSDIEYLTSLNQGELHINRRTLDDKTWLVAYESDIAPIKYYKYDRANKKAEYLFSNRDELIKYELNTLNPLVIKARDGLDLVSYLTLPNHMTVEDVKKSGQLLPLVLYVHGGPWARDNWGFNPTHQWLANRGYAVLSVNFRGSTGFGKNFINAANKQWGKKMHDDLIDAVNWVVKSKIVDSKKVAIMGGSYGGYATLAGLTFTPDFFACGIDIVGPSNILTLIKSVPPYWEPILNDFKKRVGNWETEADLKALAEASPLTYADRIKKPLFIAQGVHDPRVKQAESDQIVKALNDKNIPVIYALYDDEGHGFARAESRLSFYALAEQFLAKILKGQAEPIGDDLNGANFLLNNTKPTNIEAEKLIDKAIGK